MKERIVCQRIVAQTRNHIKIIASYDSGKNLNVDTVINIIPKTKDFNVKYLLAILNSKFASYYLYNFVYNRAVRSMNFEYSKYLPIKNTHLSEQNKIAKMVEELLISSSQGKDIKEMEKNLDNKIYEIYGLSKIEIETIENLE